MWRKNLQTLLVVLFAVLQVHALVHSPPRIIKQPPTDELLYQVAQQSNENDKPFLIECEAEGEPAPKYRWIKNGKQFNWQTYDDRMSQQPGRGTIVITRPRDEDLGQYQCFAENEHGTATSNSVFVRKAELNTFKDEQPKTVTANEGDPFKLQCQPPDGWPKPNVYWLIQNTDGGIKSINNSRMTLDPEGNLHFSNVTRYDASDDFYYACAATSVFRNEYKLGNRILLDVVQTGISPTQNKHQPTQQYVSRKNEVALRGKKVELYCIYGGTPLPQTIWSKDGQAIHWNDRITQGNYGKSLIIRHATFEDAGSYTCEASNGVGNAQSYSINLKVNAVPYFTIEPEIQNAAEDESVEFHCEASGVPEPEIKWIYNGKPIQESARNDRRSVQSNKITITGLKSSDTGNYGCNATNSLGYVYKDVYLNVLALPPEITEPPRKEATVDRRTVTLRCRVFGAPAPEVKWLRNDLELTGGRYQTQSSGDLVIQDVTFADAGDYTCHAQNKLGETKASGTLIVKEHTKITDEPQDYEVTAGNPATFRCNAVADSSLDLNIKWLSDDEEIDFENEPRFVRTNDNSLTISKTSELDSGQYTCVASTDLDEARASATLIVQDVPNAPQLTGISCHAREAFISWKPLGDNRAPILYYTIQYNTSFTPDIWTVAYDKVPSTDFTYNVPMSPWANYTFRVIAFNKIGPSQPSGHSESCTTQLDVPFKNPDDVKGEGTTPTNLVISWTHMPQIEHNGPDFHYRLSWKRDIPTDNNWNHDDIYDWRKDNYVILDQPTFVRYRIKVLAVNKKGESNTAPIETFGYSGEDHPTQAPTNFTLVQVTASTSAILSWNPVPIESINGHFKGYKVQTWTDVDGEENTREIHVKGDSTQALVTKFLPDAINYARVLAFNSRYNGPPSAVIDFKTPEGVPSSVQSFEAFPLGSSAFLLRWKKPLQPNGKLTGYKVYYEEVLGTAVQSKLEREPHIDDPRSTQAKLAGLKENTKYRIHIVGTTKAGEGEDYFIEQKTLPGGSYPPDRPEFIWEQLPSENPYPKVKVHWLPNVNGRPGTHFYAKYRIKGETQWETTKDIIDNDFVVIPGLEPDRRYEFIVTSVDGDHFTESAIQEVQTVGEDGPNKVPSENMAAAGWLIGMLLAIALLLLLLIIVCIIKRNRGGKYDVYDRELANGRRDYPEEGGFHEYSQPLDNKSAGRQSIASNLMKPEDEVDDGDSMAAYGEGDTVGQFAEDGSFIGQYVPGKLNPPVSPPTPHSSHQLQTVSSKPQLPNGNGNIGPNSGAIATYV
ncbi:neuroglian-like isoform X2 [Contarinia nasturtii]|uniref:neuroglian-like isoform X2 n=1 Tax=Contarinia nasturtii TaxID=265458 RepID=UPI0012D47B7A|nr:neuroglian-like isoform X2 [Contarinia nasturtii]